MSKKPKDDDKDMFGFTESAPEENGDDDGDDGDDETDEIPYVIMQIVPAPGWRAIFVSEDGLNERIQPLACFALVEIPQPLPMPPVQTETELPIGVMPVRTVRPMVVDENGQVEDVESFDDFLLILGPDDENVIPDNIAVRTKITTALAARVQQPRE